MRPWRKKYRVATALLLTMGAMGALSAPPTHAAAAPGCPLEIVGTWKSASPEPRLLNFSRDGWANVLSEDLDILAQVRYEFAPRREPRRVGFQARRGNDLFPAGGSDWEITAYTDETFSARPSGAVDGEQFHWTRVQTHRYFVTFAARDDAALFVMLTTLDGNTTGLEAMGTTTRNAKAGFGRIPQTLASAFLKHGERTDAAMLRVELSEAEYHRTHQVFVSWDTLVSRDLLAREDPRRQALLLVDATLQSMNRCGLRIRTAGEIAATNSTALAVVRSIRKLNDRWHVPDKTFPFRWQPPAI